MHYTEGKAHLTEEAAILGVKIASATLDISDPSDVKLTVSNDLSSPTPYAATSLTRNEYPDGAQHQNNSSEGAAQFDAIRTLDAGIFSTATFGVKYRREAFSRYSTRRDLVANIAAAYTPDIASDGDQITDFLDGNDSIQHSWIAPNMQAYEAALAPAGLNVPFVFDPSGSYGVTRKIASIYAMVNLKGEVFSVPFHGDIGLRDEDTRSMVKGYITGTSNPVNTNVNLVTGTYATPSKYNNVLPSANVTFDLMPNLLLRAAAAKVMVRPVLDTTSLATTVSTGVSGGVRQISVGIGSATLRPLTANQLDLSLEWYYGAGNGLSVAAFTKDVKNGIYTATNLCPASFNGTGLSTVANECVDSSGAVYSISQTLNDPSVVKIKGYEVNWQQSFDEWLPVKGFGVTSNYTYVEPHSKKAGFYIANLSRTTANLTTYWENRTFSARLSANYRSAYNQTSAESFFATENHTIEGRTQYDFTVGYNINDSLSLSIGGLNITNAKEMAYKDIKTRWQMTSIVGPSYYISLQYKM